MAVQVVEVSPTAAAVAALVKQEILMVTVTAVMVHQLIHLGEVQLAQVKM